jgi:hypothetical protein
VGDEPALEPEVLKAVTVGVERTFEQDPALALRLLADTPTVDHRITRSAAITRQRRQA